MGMYDTTIIRKLKTISLPVSVRWLILTDDHYKYCIIETKSYFRGTMAPILALDSRHNIIVYIMANEICLIITGNNFMGMFSPWVVSECYFLIYVGVMPQISSAKVFGRHSKANSSIEFLWAAAWYKHFDRTFSSSPAQYRVVCSILNY